MTRVHISLHVSDIERAVSFYSQMLGQAPNKRRPDYANYRVDEPGLMLSLVSGDTDAAGPMSEHRHYGIELDSADALETLRERIATTELAMRREDDIVCCYARADKFWLSDPDGNAWEFWVRTADAESMYEAPPQPVEKSAPASAETSSCCG